MRTARGAAALTVVGVAVALPLTLSGAWFDDGGDGGALPADAARTGPCGG